MIPEPQRHRPTYKFQAQQADDMPVHRQLFLLTEFARTDIIMSLNAAFWALLGLEAMSD